MKNIAYILLFSLITGAAVFIAMGGLNKEPQPDDGNVSINDLPVTEAEMRKKLTEVKMRRDQVNNSLKFMEKQQKENIEYLKSKGITKSADAQGDADATVVLHNLKSWDGRIKKLNKDLELYDNTIFKMEGMLTKMLQETMSQKAALTDDEKVELMAIERELSDKLGLNENDVFEDSAIDELLDELNK